MKWLIESTLDNRTGRLSSTRITALAAGLTLSFCTAFLSVASYFKPELLVAVMALGPSLAGLAAMNYGVQRWANKGEKNEPFP